MCTRPIYQKYFLCLGNKEPELAEKITTPVFHAHGTDDQMISFERGGKLTSEILKKNIESYQFHSIPDMGHEATEEEMILVQNWIKEKCPEI